MKKGTETYRDSRPTAFPNDRTHKKRTRCENPTPPTPRSQPYQSRIMTAPLPKHNADNAPKVEFQYVFNELLCVWCHTFSFLPCLFSLSVASRKSCTICRRSLSGMP